MQFISSLTERNDMHTFAHSIHQVGIQTH